MSGYLQFYAQQKAISDIAELLNCAGDSYHHTGSWGEEDGDGVSHIGRIQSALNAADRSHAAALERITELEADLEKMTRQRNQAMEVVRETQTELFKYRDAGDGVYMEALKAENTRLRHHAEAMAYVMEERWNGHKNEEAMADALDALDKASDAYRAEFKEVR